MDRKNKSLNLTGFLISAIIISIILSNKACTDLTNYYSNLVLGYHHSDFDADAEIPEEEIQYINEAEKVRQNQELYNSNFIIFTALTFICILFHGISALQMLFAKKKYPLIRNIAILFSLLLCIHIFVSTVLIINKITVISSLLLAIMFILCIVDYFVISRGFLKKYTDVLN